MVWLPWVTTCTDESEGPYEVLDGARKCIDLGDGSIANAEVNTFCIFRRLVRENISHNPGNSYGMKVS